MCNCCVCVCVSTVSRRNGDNVRVRVCVCMEYLELLRPHVDDLIIAYINLCFDCDLFISP